MSANCLVPRRRRRCACAARPAADSPGHRRHLAGHGPAALTTGPPPAGRRCRDDRRHAASRLPLDAGHRSGDKSMFFPRSALRNNISMAWASNQPSPRAPERTGGDPLGREPGKPPLERAGVLQHDVGPSAICTVVCLEDRQAVFAGKDQVAAFAKADVGAFAEFLLQPPEQRQRELRKPYVFGNGKLLPYRGAGQCRRGMGELRVALDQRDRAGKSFLAQVIGDELPTIAPPMITTSYAPCAVPRMSADGPRQKASGSTAGSPCKGQHCRARRPNAREFPNASELLERKSYRRAVRCSSCPPPTRGPSPSCRRSPATR